jgi:hypothetical protein
MAESLEERQNLTAITDEQTSEAPEPSPQLESEPMIFAVLDCIYYLAGDRVTGEILINMPYNYPASTLHLSSGGNEEVHMYDGPTHSRSTSQTAEVYSLTSSVKEFSDGVPPGQYVYPFTFKLPHHSPSTFSYTGDVQGCFVKATIDYFCTVELVVHSEASLNLRHTRPILVRSRRAKGKVNEQVESVHIVPGCCCSSKGMTRLKLTNRNEDHSVTGGVVKYKLDPDNSQCSAAINHVTGITSYQMSFNLPTRTLRLRKEISTISRATWLSASTSMIYEKDFEYTAELKQPQEDWNLSSNEGALITCEYFVEVLVHFDVAFNSVPATIKLPLLVNPKNPYPREEPMLPGNWAPREVSIVNFVVESKRSGSSESVGKMSVAKLPS